MNPQTVFFPAKPRIVRKRRGASATVPAVELTLVSATYEKDNTSLTLGFDRAISIGAFDGTAIVLDDDAYLSMKFDGTAGAALVNPTTVQIFLSDIGSPTTTGVKLTASALTGIVAVDDGGTWAGGTELELPF